LRHCCAKLHLPVGAGKKLAMHEGQKFAWVLVPSSHRDPLIYRLPDSLSAQPTPGTRVLVPLQKRQVTGVILSLVDQSPHSEVKDVSELLDDQPIVDVQLLNLAQWIAQYYLVSQGDVLATMLPPNSRRDSQRLATLLQPNAVTEDELESAILRELNKRKGKVSVKTLSGLFSGRRIDRTLAKLVARGVITIAEHLAKSRRRKAPLPSTVVGVTNITTSHELNAEQAFAFNTVTARIDQGGFETFLLHGITGSGKTEVYLRAMGYARAHRRRSIILIPEISLTPQLLDQMHRHFPEKVGVLHSALTGADRWAQWWRILRGEVDVVVGARSAVFAPLPDLGLIIVDEEHDSSYKQEEGLRYNGRDVAVVRAKQLGCPVILGSATPALESYENCRQGRYKLLELTQRVEQRPLPIVETIDMRHQFVKPATPEKPADSAQKSARKPAKPRLMADSFIVAIRQNFLDRRQTLIFLNRRGFANFLQCSLCGHVWHCPHCSVTLTLHLRHKMLACHHCDYRRAMSNLCPECNNPSLAPVGTGTEQVEEALHELFPDARVARMDRDTTSKRGSQEELIRRWERGDIDILVGTQMITKGHDVAGVTLVGALSADLSLNLPDFRAGERTFQLLSQVAGRAGRGSDPGHVVIQTYTPDHYAIQHLPNHDYKGFFAVESEFRRALNYPPFARLINLRFDGPKADEVERCAKTVATQLRQLQAQEVKYNAGIEILGPAAAPIEKLRNRYRWQLLLKGKNSATILEFASHARRLALGAPGGRLQIDVDPYSML
jgi:primosomal protein N' (replication factor Y) (superfamily II helicase)